MDALKNEAQGRVLTDDQLVELYTEWVDPKKAKFSEVKNYLQAAWQYYYDSGFQQAYWVLKRGGDGRFNMALLGPVRVLNPEDEIQEILEVPDHYAEAEQQPANTPAKKRKAGKAAVIVVCVVLAVGVPTALYLNDNSAIIDNKNQKQGNIFGQNGEFVALQDLDFAEWLNYTGESYLFGENDAEYQQLTAEREMYEEYFNIYIKPAQTEEEFFEAMALFLHQKCSHDSYNSAAHSGYWERKTFLEFLDEEYYNQYNDYEQSFNYPSERKSTIYGERFPEMEGVSYKKAVSEILKQHYALNNKYGQSLDIKDFVFKKGKYELTGNLLGLSDMDPVAKGMRYEVEDYYKFLEELPEFNMWYYGKYGSPNETLEDVSWDIDKFVYYQMSLKCYNNSSGPDGGEYFDIYEYVEEIHNGLTPYKPYKSMPDRFQITSNGPQQTSTAIPVSTPKNYDRHNSSNGQNRKYNGVNYRDQRNNIKTVTRRRAA